MRRLRALDVGITRLLLALVAQLAWGETPLNEWPMIMTHDAASGYLLGENPIYAWTRTQPPSPAALTEQLNCGARSFDLRAEVAGGGALVFRHGEVEIKHDVASALREVVDWVREHPSIEDLVLIYSSSCGGANCSQRLRGAFAAAGLRAVDGCGPLAGLTLEAAADMGRLREGGHALVVTGCVEENYNASLTCSGVDRAPAAAAAAANGTEGYYHCWIGGHGRAAALERLLDYSVQVSARLPVYGHLWMLQAHWQESAMDVAVGTLWKSSLLLDEERSGLNALMVEKIDQGLFPHINLFEVNNVCDHGLELLQALRLHSLRSRGRME